MMKASMNKALTNEALTNKALTNKALMHDVLVNAIENKQRLRCLFDHTPRVVEPQCYGIGTRGTELLRVHH